MNKVIATGALALAFCGMGIGAANATDTPETVEVFWAMPAGATGTNVLWPQMYQADPNALTCGVWYQADTYLASEAPLFYADGILTLGEDYGSNTQTGAIQWRFVYGGDCLPPVEPPVEEPPVVVPPTVEPPVVDVPVSTEPELAYTATEVNPMMPVGAALVALLGGVIVVRDRLKGRGVHVA